MAVKGYVGRGLSRSVRRSSHPACTSALPDSLSEACWWHPEVHNDLVLGGRSDQLHRRLESRARGEGFDVVRHRPQTPASVDELPLHSRVCRGPGDDRGDADTPPATEGTLASNRSGSAGRALLPAGQLRTILGAQPESAHAVGHLVDVDHKQTNYPVTPNRCCTQLLLLSR